ncbi:MAG: Stealth CR1 domain-containing protein [Bacteroidota bacterium]|nr:Stealth CR1 domain-containing protein [Bacteroidota bacterium]
MNSSVEFPVDVVVTWVNGNDLEYQKKLSDFKNTEKFYKSAGLLSRYKQIGEINLCVKSILKFAPFVRKIFIVTDQQNPKIKIKKKEEIILVDHKDIFKGYENFLPTFNIRTIEAAFHRIKNLSEHFIYFNDDMFLIKPTTIYNWFNKDFKPIIRGKWSRSYNKIWYKRLRDLIIGSENKRPGYNRAQSKSGEQIGFVRKYYKSYHTGRPMLKSVSAKYFSENPDVFKNQIKYRFRNSDQFLPYSLNWHLMIKSNKAILTPNIGAVEIHNIKKKNLGSIKKIIKFCEAEKSVFSINIQDINQASNIKQKYLMEWIHNITK